MDPAASMQIHDLERAKRERLLKLVILGVFCLVLAPFVVPSALRIRAGQGFPHEMDSEEGFVLWQAWQLRHGHTIFRPLTSPPYVVATYGPLFPLVNAAFLWGEVPTLSGGRLISALSVAAICLFMALIIWGETRQALAALFGPLLFLNSYDVYLWLPFYRVDFMALALGMAALWLLARTDRSEKWRVRVACACFVAMAYTKQVELAPLVAAWLYFAYTGHQTAWRLCRNVVAWGVGIAVVLTVLTRGQFLVHNVYCNANAFSLWQIKTILRVHFSTFYRFLAIAVAVCLIWLIVERWRSRAPAAHQEHGENEGREEWGRLGLFAVYAAVASLDILGLGKAGAATNYLIEPNAAWSLLVALVLGKTVCSHDATGKRLCRRPVFFPVAVVLALHVLEFLCSSTVVPALGYWIARHPGGTVDQFARSPIVLNYLRARPQILARDVRNPSVVDLRNGNQAVELLRQVPGEVMSERPVLAMRAGKAVYMQPFIMKELALEKKWDQTPVVEAFRRKEFALIVTTEDISNEGFFFHYTDEMVAAMREAYRLRETLDGTSTTAALANYYLFEPREEGASEKGEVRGKKSESKSKE